MTPPRVPPDYGGGDSEGAVYVDDLGYVTVDFSGTARFGRATKNHSGLTEYDDVDLASGYPAHLVWTTKDGRRIAIPNMSNDHLLNTLALLTRGQRDLSNPYYIPLLQEARKRGILVEVDDRILPHPGDLIDP